jgi:hypothetical protein
MIPRVILTYFVVAVAAAGLARADAGQSDKGAAAAAKSTTAARPSAKADTDTWRDSLSRADIDARLAEFVPEVGDCYKKHAMHRQGATGTLEVTLVIHRLGFVKDVSIAAPGVRGKAAQALYRCVQPLVAHIGFPARKYTTVATMPFYFLRTRAGRAGPAYSCWNKRGCPSKRRR